MATANLHVIWKFIFKWAQDVLMLASEGIQQPDSLVNAMSHLLRPHFVDEMPITTDRLDPTSPFLDVVLIDQEGRLTGCA